MCIKIFRKTPENVLSYIPNKTYRGCAQCVPGAVRLIATIGPVYWMSMV